MRLPKVGPQPMTWYAGNAADGRNPLSGYLSPLRDSTPLNAEFTSDQSPETTAGGGAKKIHSGKRGGHPSTLRGTKRQRKPKFPDAPNHLLSTPELAVCHISGMTIGETIQAARVKLGFTQRYVAKMLKVTPGAVNQWESGTTEPSITNRARLAILLNLRMSDLIPGAPVDEITEAIVQLVRGVPPSEQAALVISVEQIAKAMMRAQPDNPPPRRTKPKPDK
jgi:transcriptional regulator with XRE-family HTH domain